MPNTLGYPRHLRRPGAIDPNAGAAWRPNLIASCMAYYAADLIQGASEGQAIASWDDQTGHGYHLAQASGSLQPTYRGNQIAGQPVVRFDGGDDYLRVTFPNTVSWTLAFVARMNAAEAGEGLWANQGGLSSGQPSILCQRNGANVRYYFNGAYSLSVAWAQADVHLHVFTMASLAQNLYVDGGSPATSASSGGALNTSFYLGNGYTGYAAWDCPELAIYNGVITSQERDQLTAYLKSKYGIA